jgi:TolA-binding protein
LLGVLGSSLLVATAALNGQSPYPTGSSAHVAPPTTTMSEADRDMQALLERLTSLSDHIARNIQAPDVWRYQLQQVEILLKLVPRSKGEERDRWLRMAIDSCFSAAVQSPENEVTAMRWLGQMPSRIAQLFPGCALSSYAARQEVQADYTRMLGKANVDVVKAQAYFCDRLLHFAQQYPTSPEAPKAIVEAAQMSETNKQVDAASTYYRQAIAMFPGTPLARKAQGAVWRLNPGSEPVQLKLAMLYPINGTTEQTYDVEELRGQHVIVYFWSSECPGAGEDLQALKMLTDRYQYKGLTVVFVNLDNEVSQAKAFLSGKLTAGVHLHQKGMLESPTAERFGLQGLPHFFLLGKDGKVLEHTMNAGQIIAAVPTHMKVK